MIRRVQITTAVFRVWFDRSTFTVQTARSHRWDCGIRGTLCQAGDPALFRLHFQNTPRGPPSPAERLRGGGHHVLNIYGCGDVQVGNPIQTAPRSHRVLLVSCDSGHEKDGRRITGGTNEEYPLGRGGFNDILGDTVDRVDKTDVYHLMRISLCADLIRRVKGAQVPGVLSYAGVRQAQGGPGQEPKHWHCHPLTSRIAPPLRNFLSFNHST